MSDLNGSGRFFHTIVLLGSSLATNCGGKTTAGGPGNGGVEASGGATAAGGSASSGGGMATGGSTSGAGGRPVGSGGGPGSGGAESYGGWGGDLGFGGADDCPPEQWTCSETVGCDPVSPVSCVCDRDRPAEPEDCDVDEAFRCQPGDANGRSFRLSCECVPGARTCSDACTSLRGTRSCEEEDEAFICGCELTILR